MEWDTLPESICIWAPPERLCVSFIKTCHHIAHIWLWCMCPVYTYQTVYTIVTLLACCFLTQYLYLLWTMIIMRYLISMNLIHFFSYISTFVFYLKLFNFCPGVCFCFILFHFSLCSSPVTIRGLWSTAYLYVYTKLILVNEEHWYNVEIEKMAIWLSCLSCSRYTFVSW